MALRKYKKHTLKGEKMKKALMKKALNCMLLTILILSTFSMALTALVAPANAAVVGNLEASTDQFWGDAMVQIRLYDPDLNTNASARDVATLSITINSFNGSVTGPFAVYANESLPNSGEFYFYFANASVSDVEVDNPPYGNNYYNETWGLKSGDQVVVTYNDQSPVGSVSVTVTYAPYEATAADLSFDRSSGEYPKNGFIRMYVKDLDYNIDPTAPDSVNLNITLSNPVNENSTSLILNFTETGSNTALFAMNTTVSYYTSPKFSGYLLNFTDLLNVTAPIKVTYTNETDAPAPPYTYITFKTFPVQLDVASSFTTSGDLTITVVDPNLNHMSWVKENASAVADNTNVTIKYGDDQVNVTTLWETDTNTGTFEAVVPVKVGTNQSDGILQITVATVPRIATIYYYANGTLMADTVSTLSTTPATITSDKTMYKKDAIVQLTLNASDLNDDVNNPNFLTCELPTDS